MLRIPVGVKKKRTVYIYNSLTARVIVVFGEPLPDHCWIFVVEQKYTRARFLFLASRIIQKINDSAYIHDGKRPKKRDLDDAGNGKIICIINNGPFRSTYFRHVRGVIDLESDVEII